MTKSLRILWLVAPVTGLLLLAAACSSGDKGSTPTEVPTNSPEAVAPTPKSQATQLPVISATANTQQLSNDRIVLDIAPVETKYYTVTGTTTADIFSSIDKNGPRIDPQNKGSGLTAASWGYRWQPQNSSDGCIIASMTVSLSTVVTLPQHVNEASLSATLRRNWDQFEASVAKHEQTHVDINEAGAKTIREKMTAVKSAANCDALSKQIDQVWTQEQRSIETQQDSFHSQEDARIANLRAPLQTQIDTNRARIATLGTQISNIDTSLTSMKANIENVGDQLDALKGKIDDILQKYPSGNLPTDVFSEYEELRRLYNALAPSFNQLVNQYNSAIAQRNQVADEHDKLVDATNELVDRFNWTR